MKMRKALIRKGLRVIKGYLGAGGMMRVKREKNEWLAKGR